MVVYHFLDRDYSPLKTRLARQNMRVDVLIITSFLAIVLDSRPALH